MINYNELTSKYMLGLFPEFERGITEQITFLEEELPHCIYANVINPYLRRYFGFPNKVHEPLVQRIFDFFDDFAQNGDEKSKNLLQVSLLEPLYDSAESYYGALRLMSSETKDIFEQISEYIYKPEQNHKKSRG